MTELDKATEKEAHKLFHRHKRTKIISAYFAIKDGTHPRYMDAEDAVLQLIPIRHYESYFALSMPHDSLLARIALL